MLDSLGQWFEVVVDECDTGFDNRCWSVGGRDYSSQIVGDAGLRVG